MAKVRKVERVDTLAALPYQRVLRQELRESELQAAAALAITLSASGSEIEIAIIIADGGSGYEMLASDSSESAYWDSESLYGIDSLSAACAAASAYVASLY